MAESKGEKSFRDLNRLRGYLVQELAEYQKELRKIKNINSDTILISRYILCAVLDEVLYGLASKQSMSWDYPSLVEEFYEEGYADENFFIILDRISQAPNQYLDLLELMYICLSMGYEGKFKNQVLHQAQLQQIVNYTYQLIRDHRGEINKKLSPAIDLSQQKQAVSAKKPESALSVLWIILFVFFAILVLDVLFNYLLQLCSDPLIQQLQQATEMLIR